MALTTFISQNLGAGKYDRAKKGAAFGAVCTTVGAEIIGVLISWIKAAPNTLLSYEKYIKMSSVNFRLQRF